MPNNSLTFWKRKLAAYLHDPPSKCLDIVNHWQQSEKSMQAAGLGTPEERKAWTRLADHTAAATDRFPFPDSRKAGLHCVFDGVRNQFHHPLSGDLLAFDGPVVTIEEGIEGEQTSQPVIHDFGSLTEEESMRARFFAHWRLWAGACSQKDWRLGYLPADTRIPDHSIWAHMQMVSAFEGSFGLSGKSRPALLKFQIGPVQEFIQAARSTRDLWSGSYLLSWLMAQGMARLALEVGPDTVVFPNLREQPLFDLALKDKIWEKVKIGNQPIWKGHDAMNWSGEQLLTPNLPNVFLALVPQEQAKELAQKVEKAIREEWHQIADSVWTACEGEKLWECNGDLPKGEALKARWDDQVGHCLNIAWCVTPIPTSLEEIEKLHEVVPALKVRGHYAIVKKAAEAIRELGDEDERFFTSDGKLKNEGIAWSLAVSLISWELDAVRQTRAFAAKAPVTDDIRRQGKYFEKDSLTGKDEAVAGGDAWKNATGGLGHRFKHDDFLSAPGVIKRLWDITYLEKKWTLPRQKMPNTRSLAAGNPGADDADDEFPADEGEKYFAVLAFDGDDMGKWVAGEKTPKFVTQLASYGDGGSLEYFKREGHAGKFAAFLETPRPLSPGYHLQFSECLSNFALRCGHDIVKSFNGRLIYAGGDDVVALLPADTALACARELSIAFKGGALSRDQGHGLWQKSPGFLVSQNFTERTGKSELANERPIPFPVPGPKATASVGIAIAHYKSPLQDAVRAAQVAEKRAKKNPGKDSVAVTVLKRSGETVEWSAPWSHGGVDAALLLLRALKDEVVSAKFPYRLSELISIYRNRPAPMANIQESAVGFDLAAIVSQELRTVLERQQGPTWKNGGAEFAAQFNQHLKNWIEQLQPDAGAAQLDQAIAQLNALCAFCGFAKRQTNTSF
jgi:CRISPR-associated protein Cmr2